MTTDEQIAGLERELEAHRMLLKSEKLANKILSRELRKLQDDNRIYLIRLSRYEAK